MRQDIRQLAQVRKECEAEWCIFSSYRVRGVVDPSGPLLRIFASCAGTFSSVPGKAPNERQKCSSIPRGDGSITRRLAQLAKMGVLLLDDWGLQDVDQGTRNDLLEVLDDRVGTRSTIITSQLSLGALASPAARTGSRRRNPRPPVRQAHKLPLKVDSMRKKNAPDQKIA
ncbi:ATP-binding protein [Paraburkholderia sp. Ac-20347]|uniref:ATP-binding protein n=1 Tax=Paraburkholderia sp. Ac-20347 TaxID=2703892 RepID=UPI001F1242B8|nr:ATP-binding protein [Paraburkholderia sp. Ac-20347]